MRSRNCKLFKALFASYFMITFARRKSDCLSKDDKSSIGSWDKHILELCEKINSRENYYTLSSCSGRVVLIKNVSAKTHGLFVFRSHDKISFNQLMKELNENVNGKEGIIFKQEPPILHVCCASLEDSEKLLNLARECGWKNSGVMSLQGRIVLELRSTESLALPIIENKKILVDEEFIKILVKESNKKLEKGWEKIYKLEKSL